jgi:CRISPR-associated protein Csm2
MGNQTRAQSKSEREISQELYQIIGEGDAQQLVIQAEKIGKKLKELNLTTNQIRAIFGTVRQIEMEWSSEAPANKRDEAQRKLILLKPKMKYRASREDRRGRGLDELAEVLGDSIDLVFRGENDATKRQRFGFLVEFFEAILAYHAVAGGK